MAQAADRSFAPSLSLSVKREAAHAANHAGLDWAMLLGLALVFGSAFFFGDLGLESFGPLSVASGRVVSAAIILIIVALLRGRRFPADLKTWAALLVMGAINNAIPFSLIFWGQTHIDSGLWLS